VVVSDQFYLQDSRGDVGDRLSFWATKGCGYTTNLDGTELFTKESAEWHYKGRETDVPWPKEYIDARSETACDMQYVCLDDEGAAQLGDECLVQRKNSYNGNDLVWVSVTSGYTTNVDLAQVMTASEAKACCAANPNHVAWAKPYIDARVRRVVTRRHVNLKEALRGTGIEIIKPKRPRKDRINCNGCGRFLYEDAIYSDCPHCRADNRP
jgi:hypothetical protein